MRYSWSTFIVAEAGVNHNGDLSQALRLIDAARTCGADAVKFQMFSAEKLRRPELKTLELTHTAMETIHRHCEGIEFMCTPFDVESLKFLVDLGVKRIKIASGCIRDRELLYASHQTGLPVILSTGMATLEHVRAALAMLVANVTILHCTSTYPCPLLDINLRAMDTLRKTFGYPVGFSDHSAGIVASLAAVSRDASVIEKHLTLDRQQHGPDHFASIEPDNFTWMVKLIRNIETLLGDGVKQPMPSEAKTRKIWFPTES